MSSGTVSWRPASSEALRTNKDAECGGTGSLFLLGKSGSDIQDQDYQSNSFKLKTGPSLQASFHERLPRTAQMLQSARLAHGIEDRIKD
jgi:hypothetical protein